MLASHIFFLLGRLRDIQAGLNAAQRKAHECWSVPLFLRWKANIVGLG
jgi:hypothetical protein